MTKTTTKFKRPTPSTLAEWENFSTVNDDIAQMRLARAMGYPPSWRVVRSIIEVPIPNYLATQMKERGSKAVTITNNDDDDTKNKSDAVVRSSSSMSVVRDRIYAGHPSSQPDGYYNHTAAYLACSKMPWRPEYDDVIHDNNDDDYDDDDYCVTSHRNKGGQLKGREARYKEGDYVEVLYDEDEDTEPEWYEATVVKKVEYQDDIRYDVHYTIDDAIQSNVREDKIRPSTKKPKKKKMAASSASKAFTPKGKQSGKKRAAASSASSSSKSTPATKKGRGRPAGSKNKKQKVENVYDDDDDEEEENEDMIIENDEIELDEGDPPWRTNGHEYISRSIRYNNKVGKVVGWISDTDVDSEGNPGFVGSTGEAACLFHAIFRDFRQDFEEWELIECLI